MTLPGLGSPLLGTNRGTVHATAYQTTSKRCQVERWTSTIPPIGFPSALQVDVACHTAAGTAADAKFVMQFTR